MAKTVNVLVSWVGLKSASLPNSLQYTTVSKFKEDKATWDKEAWSVVLEFKEPPLKQGNPSQGTVRFLVEDAPVQRLKKDKVFELYEGKIKAADVRVI